MKSQTAQLLINVESLLIKYTPWLFIFSVAVLVTSLVWKMSTLNSVNIVNTQSWNISVIEPNTSQIQQYVAHSEPILVDNTLEFLDENGTVFKIPYNPGTSVIIREECRSNDDSRTRTE